MTRPDHARSNGRTGEPESPRDDVLLDAAHSGDAEAFGALRERYHGTALAVARARTGSAQESENVTAAAFGRIEQVVGEGNGPRAFLGAFVVWMVGREVDGGTRPVALPDDPADPASLIRVFSGLPAEWQAFLWHTEILGHSARRAAAARGFGSVAAAGLHRDVFRGLRGLYGQAAADRAAGPDCAEFSGELAHFVRGTRGQRSRRDVKEHLDGCARCTAEYLARQDIGTGLRTWTLPVLAGLPLWGTEALELANLIAGAGAGSGAAAGAAGAGAGAAGVGAGAAAARADEAAGPSPWSGRRAKVLLGAGALATAVAVAAVGATGGGDPVPAAGGLAAEQAPRTAQDLEDTSADEPAAGAQRTDDGGSGASEPEEGSARSEESAAGSTPDGGPAGALGDGVFQNGAFQDGAPREAAAVLADAGAGSVVAADADGASGGAPASSGDDGAARTGSGAERPDPVRGGARAAEADAPGAASAGGTSATGGTSGESRSGDASTGTTPSAPEADAPSPAQKTGTPSPVPSVHSSLPAVAVSPAPLKAPAPPAGAVEPPKQPARMGTGPDAGRQHAGRQHAHAGADGSRGRQAEREPRHRGRGWQEDRSEGRKDAGDQGRDQGRDRGRGHDGHAGRSGGGASGDHERR